MWFYSFSQQVNCDNVFFCVIHLLLVGTTMAVAHILSTGSLKDKVKGGKKNLQKKGGGIGNKVQQLLFLQKKVSSSGETQKRIMPAVRRSVCNPFQPIKTSPIFRVLLIVLSKTFNGFGIVELLYLRLIPQVVAWNCFWE